MSGPYKRTDERVKRILDCLKAGATRTAAAEANGVDRETLRLWMRDDLAFLAQVIQAEAAAEIAMTKSLTRGARKSWGAAVTWLERRRPQEWRETKEIIVRTEAERIAAAAGLDVAEVLAEAERIAGGRA